MRVEFRRDIASNKAAVESKFRAPRNAKCLNYTTLVKTVNTLKVVLDA